MKPGPIKLLPYPCTRAEEARVAIETLEREYPAEAGLIGRLMDRVELMSRTMRDMHESADDAAAYIEAMVRFATKED